MTRLRVTVPAMPKRLLVRTCVATVSVATTLTLVATLPATAAPIDPEAQLIEQLRGSANSFKTGALPGPTPRLATTASANARIASKLVSRSQHKEIGSNYAVNVVDVESGETVWGYRPTASLLPASNMKIVTAVAALRTMGPDKRFTTKVVSLGKGKVLLVGGGDATLGATGMKKLAARLAKKIKADPALLPDLKQPAPVRPATCIRKGKRVKSTKKKPCPLVAQSARRELKIYVDDSLYPAPVRPAGWRSGYEPSVVRPVRALGIDGSYSWDSSAVAANSLAGLMRKKGLYGVYKGRKATPAGAADLASYTGATVADQVRYMLQVSENNVAEMLFRNSAIAKGYYPTWANSEQATREVLAELNVPMGGVQIKSGSGVARNDRLTPIALTTMLRAAADRATYPELETIYYGGGMPLAGRSGTLSSGTGRFTTSPTSCAAGKIRAKTGTLFDTVGLSGLTVGTDGKLKAFSILVNSRPQRYTPLQTRRKVDRIATTVNGCW